MAKILSKSKYMSGLQCPKLLWFLMNAPEQVPPPDAETEAKFAAGHVVGDIAKQLYPDGEEVAFELGFAKTISKTTELVAEKKIIFEGSFAPQGLYCRADILVPEEDGWVLIEVKSSTQVKEEHLEDVAFQLHCLRTKGLNVKRCYVMYVNTEYVKDGEIDPKAFLAMEDVTEEVNKRISFVPERVAEMQRIIAGPCPDLLVGPHCTSPYECNMTQFCWKFLPEENVTQLYWDKKKGFDLLSQGIARLTEVPEDFLLSPKQTIQVTAAKREKLHIDKEGVERWLSRLEYPLCFLDFETFNPAVPLFDGTHPYEHVPFQLSLHILDSPEAEMRHVEFLAEKGDPREGIVNALHTIGPSGSIVAYNAGFERRVIATLAAQHPELAALDSRFVDLLEPFRNFLVYHPAQRGSCSMKAVLPAFTGKSYDSLEIGQGGLAQREYLRVTYEEENAADEERVRKALLIYCCLDTQGMIDILKKLEELVSE